MSNINYYYIKVCDNSNKNKFDNELEYCLTTKSIGINFSFNKSLKNLKTEKEIYNFIKQSLSNTQNYNSLNLTDKKISNISKNYNKFINIMNKGDIIFLCKGNNEILYISVLDGDYYFDKKNKNNFVHRRKLSSIREFNTTATKTMAKTIYNL